MIHPLIVEQGVYDKSIQLSLLKRYLSYCRTESPFQECEHYVC